MVSATGARWVRGTISHCFDLDSADVINGQLVKVDGLDIVYSQADNPYFVSRFYARKAESQGVAESQEAEGRPDAKETS